MGPLGIRTLSFGVAGLVAAIIVWLPSIVWAHEMASPDRGVPGSISVQTLSASVLAIWIWCALRLCSSPHLRRLRRAHGRAAPWALAAILSLFLLALPPHLVHHLLSPQEQGQQCTLFVLGNLSDQERAERVTPVIAPSLDATVAKCPTPPALSSMIPTPSGRSPPLLCI